MAKERSGRTRTTTVSMHVERIVEKSRCGAETEWGKSENEWEEIEKRRGKVEAERDGAEREEVLVYPAHSPLVVVE